MGIASKKLLEISIFAVIWALSRRFMHRTAHYQGKGIV